MGIIIRLKAKYRQTGGAGSSPKSKPSFAKPGWWQYGANARYEPLDASKTGLISDIPFPHKRING